MYFNPILLTKGNQEEQKNKALEITKKLLKDFSIINPNFKIIESSEPSIGIEIIKNLKTQMGYKPFSDKYSVFFIPGFDTATTQAQNAALKMLEEPTENIQIILGTLNFKKLLPTIISRCLTVDLINNDNYIPDPIIENFIKGDIKERFKYIINLFDKSKDKYSPEMRKQILYFVDNLIINYSTNLEVNYHMILKLLKYKSYLEANVNKRLILENIVLDLDDLL